MPFQNSTKNSFKIYKYTEQNTSLEVPLAASKHPVFPLRYFSNHLCLEFASKCILEIHDTFSFWMALNQLAVNVEKSLFLMKKYWWQNSISRTTLTISQQCNKTFPSLPPLYQWLLSKGFQAFPKHMGFLRTPMSDRHNYSILRGYRSRNWLLG